tara:strand:- start:106 stop:318 length:213 start_codon:yes stop_codon:yes gene_type:complete
MPTKFKPTQKTLVRGTKSVVTTHFYIKNTPKSELFEYLNSSNAKPKIKQKVRNELTRRGIKIVYKTPEDE